jgi:hypothetical protein
VAGRQGSSFCEQKEAKKLFPHWTRRVGVRESRHRRLGMDKSFLLLFFKKEDTCLFRPPTGRSRP